MLPRSTWTRSKGWENNTIDKWYLKGRQEQSLYQIRCKRQMLRSYYGNNISEDITLISIKSPNEGMSKYIRQLLSNLKTDIGKHIIVVGNFNIPLSPKVKQTRQK